jgi:hypothetical protein
VGETVTHHGRVFRVTELAGRRISRVEVRSPQMNASEEDEETAGKVANKSGAIEVSA